MTAFFNLVSTQSLDGDHTTLQRWYADHIQLLLRFDRLDQARLFQRADLQSGSASTQTTPDYLCLYRFSSAEAFAAFETSTERADGSRLANPAWMATGIRIVARQQFERQLHRVDENRASASMLYAFELMRMEAQDLPNNQRWLSSCAHQQLQPAHIASAEIYTQARLNPAAETDCSVLSITGFHSDHAAHMRGQNLGSVASGHEAGTAPTSLETLWQSVYRPIGSWSR